MDSPVPLPALLHCSPSACFFSASWKNKHTQENRLAVDQSGATKDPALSNRTHFWGRSGWSCFLSPMACLAGLVLVLTLFEKCQLISTSLQPGVGGGSAWSGGGHKPGSRTLVLGGLGASPTPRAVCGSPTLQQAPWERSGTAKPSRVHDCSAKAWTAGRRRRPVPLDRDDHVAHLVLSAFCSLRGPPLCIE